MAVGVLAFVANAALRPAIARAADATEPSVTVTAPAPAGAQPAQAAPAPTSPVQTTPAPARPAQGYPPAGYAPPAYPPTGYPPPGYAYPGYAPYPGYVQPPPMQLTKVHRPRRGLVTGGAITFGVTWGIAATISLMCSGSCSSDADYLWVPIAGPLFLADNSSDGIGFLLLWSASQAVGAAMLIVGLVGHDVMEYQVAKGGPTLHLTPMLARDTGGMALTARW